MKRSARLVCSVLLLVIALNGEELSTGHFFAITGEEWRDIFAGANLCDSSGVGQVCVSNACCDSEMLEKLAGAMMASLDGCEQVIQKRKKELSIAHKFLEYKTLRDTISYNWSKAFLQRKEWSAGIQELMDSLALQDEFEKRLADSSDSLDDVLRYRGLLSIPGVAARLYWKAEKLYWRGQYDKAMKALGLFVLPENKDGFSTGAAHFYIGKMYFYGQTMPDGSPNEECYRLALEHFIKVPTYPTCLTYTSYSYIDAARAAYELGDYRSAVALAFVDVPSVDWEKSKSMRHDLASQACLKLFYYTNCVLHLQEALRYGSQMEAWEIMRWVPYADREGLWNWCSTNRLGMAEMQDSVVDALTNCESVVEFDDLLHVLSLEWPAICDLPESIRTNRVLNNHFFRLGENARYQKYRKYRKR